MRWRRSPAPSAASYCSCIAKRAPKLLERAKPLDRDAPQPKIALRNYGIGAQILKDLKVKKMRLLALPRRMPSMAGFDLEVTGYMQPGDVNRES